MPLPAIGEVRRSGQAAWTGGGTNSARGAPPAASACCLARWPAAEDGAAADGGVGRADAPVLVGTPVGDVELRVPHNSRVPVL